MEGRVEIVFKNSATTKKEKTNVSRSGFVQSKQIEKEDLSDRLNTYAVKTMAKIVSQAAMSGVEYTVNKYYDLTDNVRGQRNRQIAKGVIQRVGRAASTIASGFIAGGIVGAVIGAVGSIVREGIEIYEGYDKQQIEMSKQNAQLQYTRESLGYALIGGEKGANR